MASRTFPPLFLFFSLRIIMSALKKIEKDEAKAVLLYLYFPLIPQHYYKIFFLST